MRQELENIEYIERYLENTLNRADKHKFEQYMEQDASFRETVNLQRQITNQVKEEAFLIDVSAYHQQFIQQKAGISIHPLWLLLPFSLIAICLVGWWYTQTPTTKKSVPAPITTKTQIPTITEVLATKNETAIVQANAFKPAFVSKKVSARKGATIQLKGSNSILSIPKNAVVDKAGNLIRGAYDLQYRELNDRAQMVFSDLPMRYKNKDGAHGFNSAGILEIRAFKDGEELQIAPNKALTLDYEVSRRMTNLELYHLEEEAQIWEPTDETVQLPRPNAYIESFDSIAYKKDVAAYKEKFQKPKKTRAQLDGSTWNASTTLMPDNMEKIIEEQKPAPNQYVVKHYANPKLVKELQLNSFGVYNCGQIYQVKNQIAVAARYTNLQKTVIENAQTLSIIDMNYNAAYSFKPAQFICNATANNVFLLWSNDGKLYSFVKRSTVKMSTGKYSFQMEDLSERVKNTKDLRRYLKFVAKKTRETVTKIE